MPTHSVRPSISETSYRFFDRPLHPELFSPSISGRIRTTHGELVIGICEGGHVVQATSAGKSLVEVTAPDNQIFSTAGHQQTYFFNDDEEVIVEVEKPFGYHFAGHIDAVDFSIFTRVQLELEITASRAFLSYQFPAHNRLFPGPLSLIQVEGSDRMMTIHTFHTFPEDLVILRTQSLFEWA